MAKRPGKPEALSRDPLWYKSGVIYEVHVRAFYDRDGNGTGDFPGLTEKLGYLQDLGVTAVWLLPFYPSPLRDDGYDIADYYSVHPLYGTLADFRLFLDEAHSRGLRVITELVLNHTSDQHPWFQRARRASRGSRWRNFYVWSDDPHQYKDATVIFKEVESSNWAWDPIARQHYWHRFFSHQPDLNYDNPEVHEAIFDVVDFWLDLGVDGLRLDAVPYLYEREGTNCENLPETHAFLKNLRAHVDANYGDRILLAEANLWPEDAVSYFGKGRGDESHMAFHFPLMPRLFMGLRMEDRLPIVDILEQTPPLPETGQWALFLRNHDELALSMVTDEERDYMYRMYAQTRQARLYLGIRRRLAPLLGNDRKRIELLNALLFSLPGTPVLYYGDEIGLGENIYLGDRNGVRTPMQWSSDKNAGFSRANPQSLYLPVILAPEYHYEAVNVEVQLANPHSLLWWMRRLLALRKRWRALGEGECQFLHPENRKILSYVLRYQEEILLIVANLSRFAQAVELDLSPFRQRIPIELFGRTAFPSITAEPYRLSLAPHGFYWFSLEAKHAAQMPERMRPSQLPSLLAAEDWDEILDAKWSGRMEPALSGYLKRQSWFAGKRHDLKSLSIVEAIPLPPNGRAKALLTLLQVEYVQHELETYLLPLAFAAGSEAARLREELPALAIAELKVRRTGETGILFDAFGSDSFRKAVLQLFSKPPRSRRAEGRLRPLRLPQSRSLLDEAIASKSELFRSEHSSAFFEDKIVLKLLRRLEPGTNPEVEVGRLLAEREFPHFARFVGALECAVGSNETTTLAVVREFVPKAVNAWHHTLEALGRYFDRAITWVAQDRPAPAFTTRPNWFQEIPREAVEDIGTYLESARRLGERLADLHLVLASEPGNPELAPEPFTSHYQRSLFQSMRMVALESFQLLGKPSPALPPDVLPLIQAVVDLQPVVIQLYRDVLGPPLSAGRIRTHGDCRLRHVLWTGKDFVFFDFAGDSSVSISERRIKRSPLRDVAAMVRSFHYAAHAGLNQHLERGSIPRENLHKFEPWIQYWNHWVGGSFGKAYLKQLSRSDLLPTNETELSDLFQIYLLHQVLSELRHQLISNSHTVALPLRAIRYILGAPMTEQAVPHKF